MQIGEKGLPEVCTLKDHLALYLCNRNYKHAGKYFEATPKAIIRQVRDLAMLADKLAILIDSSSHEMSSCMKKSAEDMLADFKVELFGNKNEIEKTPIEFPDFIYRINLTEENLGEEAWKEKTILESVIKGCRYLSPRFREGLLSRKLITKRPQCSL